MSTRIGFFVLLFCTVTCTVTCDELKPVLRELSLPRSLKEGKSIQIHCLTDQGKLPVNFKWFFNNASLEQNDNIQITEKDDQSTVKIQKLGLSNVGTFRCAVDNEFGKDEQAVNVSFSVKPRWTSEEPYDTAGKRGEEVAVECAVTAIPKPTIRWYKIKDDTGEKEKQFDGPVLRLKMSRETQGWYRCEAQNPEGSLKKMIYVYVIGHLGPVGLRYRSAQVFDSSLLDEESLCVEFHSVD